MNQLELRTEVRRRLAEVASVFWTDAEIDDAVNLAYAEITDETEWHEQWVHIDLLQDQWYYDARTVVGERFLAIRPAFDYQTNRWLIPSVVRQLDTHDRRWERVTGEPQRVFTHGAWWIGLYPRIQSDVGRIKLYHVSLDEPLEEDDDEPGFPDTFHYALVEFALADLWAQDGETTRATQAWAAYVAAEAALFAWVQGRAAGPMMNGFDSAGASVQR